MIPSLQRKDKTRTAHSYLLFLELSNLTPSINMFMASHHKGSIIAIRDLVFNRFMPVITQKRCSGVQFVSQWQCYMIGGVQFCLTGSFLFQVFSLALW